MAQILAPVGDTENTKSLDAHLALPPPKIAGYNLPRLPFWYKHIETGLIFEKTESTPKDLAKVAAISEALELEKQGKLLSENFGLSLTRANEVARLTRHWQKASQKGMTKKEIDTFSKELLGFTFSTGHKALKRAINGDPSELDQLIEKASFHNDITPEHSVKLFNKILK